MKMILSALILLTGFSVNAAITHPSYIQQLTGKITIEADVHIPPPANPIDVLFVVDNSPSMNYSHPNKIAAASAEIDKALTPLYRDFHFGVIAADTSSAFGSTLPGVLIGSPAVLTVNDLPGGLAQNLVLPETGSQDETFFDAVKYALSEPNLSTHNKGFLRKNSAVALVFLTDAEDQSKTSTSDFLNFITTLQKDHLDVTAFSWIIPSGANLPYGCDRDDDKQVPLKIENITKSMGGEIYNICDMSPANIQDFAQKLGNFGIIAPPPAPYVDFSEIPLTVEPVLSSIEVRFGSQVLKVGDSVTGWTYDIGKNAVVLGSKVPWSQQRQGTKLVVSFVSAQWPKSH